MAAVATRPKTSTRTARNARALERARTAPAAPRRKSGPATRPRPVRKPVAAPAPRVARIAQGSASLLLDRLLRGRAWVALVGVLLAGIVFLNVSVLELNRGIAQTDAKSAALERTNSTLRGQVATLSSTERVQELAEQKGYVLPQPGDVTYLHGSPSAARLAAQRIQPPSQTSQLTVGSPQSAEPQPQASTTTTP
jgi:cell division protein FtsL